MQWVLKPLCWLLRIYDIAADAISALHIWVQSLDIRYQVLAGFIALVILCLMADKIAANGKDWTDVLRALLTPVIAVGALLISWMQYQIKMQEKKQFDFDKKWKVYTELKDVLDEVIYAASSKQGREEFAKQLDKIDDKLFVIPFVFEGEVSKKVLEKFSIMSQDKSLPLRHRLERFRGEVYVILASDIRLNK